MEIILDEVQTSNRIGVVQSLPEDDIGTIKDKLSSYGYVLRVNLVMRQDRSVPTVESLRNVANYLGDNCNVTAAELDQMFTELKEVFTQPLLIKSDYTFIEIPGALLTDIRMLDGVTYAIQMGSRTNKMLPNDLEKNLKVLLCNEAGVLYNPYALKNYKQNNGLGKIEYRELALHMEYTFSRTGWYVPSLIEKTYEEYFSKSKSFYIAPHLIGRALLYELINNSTDKSVVEA